MVEFLKDRKGDERKAGDPYIKELDIPPQSGAYIKILFNNPVMKAKEFMRRLKKNGVEVIEGRGLNIRSV